MNAPAILLLISSLSSDDFAARERVQAELQALVRLGGIRLVEEAARSHPDAEVRDRCRRVASADLDRRLFSHARGLQHRYFGPPNLDTTQMLIAANSVEWASEQYGVVYAGRLLEAGFSEEAILEELGRARAAKAELDRRRKAEAGGRRP